MKIALAILIGIHGAIHLPGFLKAFGFADFNAIAQPISRPLGLVWLAAFVLLAATLLLYLGRHDYWWLAGFLAVAVSQCLVLVHWSDARWGTVLNVVLLAAAVLAYASFSFQKMASEEVADLLAVSEEAERSVLSEEMAADLPPVVQKWLANSGAIGRERIGSVYLEQDAQMKMKPEQEDWASAKARQYFSTAPPAFNWVVEMKMAPGLTVAGRDKFVGGKGEMSIKLLSLFPVAFAGNNAKVDQATLQRYLAEIVWFPSAAVSPWITWESLDAASARATMRYGGTSGSGIFHFDEEGDFERFVAMRFMDAGDAEPTEWTVRTLKTESREGLRVPVDLEASWKMEQGEWTWLRLQIGRVAYNGDW